MPSLGVPQLIWVPQEMGSPLEGPINLDDCERGFLRAHRFVVITPLINNVKNRR